MRALLKGFPPCLRTVVLGGRFLYTSVYCFRVKVFFTAVHASCYLQSVLRARRAYRLRDISKEMDAHIIGFTWTELPLYRPWDGSAQTSQAFLYVGGTLASVSSSTPALELRLFDWVMVLTGEGLYYWNRRTGETRWKMEDGYLPSRWLRPDGCFVDLRDDLTWLWVRPCIHAATSVSSWVCFARRCTTTGAGACVTSGMRNIVFFGK